MAVAALTQARMTMLSRGDAVALSFVHSNYCRLLENDWGYIVLLVVDEG